MFQFKDKFYDEFLKNPTKDNFRKFLKSNCGELDEVDFKEKWVDKGSLAKTILAMANSRGGMIVVGIREEEGGILTPVGLDSLRDKAEINDDIAKYVSPNLDYEVLDFSYDSSEYSAVENKKFQLVLIHDTPERLPFVSLGATTGIDKDNIYIRRGTKCEKATSNEIETILDSKIETIFKGTSDISLDLHLEQLKKLYSELPQKIHVLIRKGEPTGIQSALERFASISSSIFKTNNEYEEQDNPNYPGESYEAFILRMITVKKLKIEKVLDLK